MKTQRHTYNLMVPVAEDIDWALRQLFDAYAERRDHP